MEMDSIECVSYSHGLDDNDDGDEAVSRLPRPLLKPSSAAASAAAAVNLVVVSGGGGGGGGAVAGPLITPSTSVHELLECPVCTNSMYPPIHQVRTLSLLLCCYFSE
jgi:E3 ubiquitin-protein ligase SIAH1